MAKLEKLWRELTARPTPTSFQLSDAVRLLQKFDILLARQSGSHRFFKSKDKKIYLTISTHGSSIDPGSVRDIVKAIYEATNGEDPRF